MEISDLLKKNLVADVENIIETFLGDETKKELERAFEITIATHEGISEGTSDGLKSHLLTSYPPQAREQLFEEFRAVFSHYPGSRGSYRVQFDKLCAKCKKYKIDITEAISKSKTAIEKEKQHKARLKQQDGWAPTWKHLSTWINALEWESWESTNTPQQPQQLTQADILKAKRERADRISREQNEKRRKEF
jgi:hypothetical protein